MYRRLEGECLSLCWLVGAAQYICHASLSMHNYCWGLLCIVCSAIADILVFPPVRAFLCSFTQVQSLSKWSAIVHTSCHNNHKRSGRSTPFRCSGGTGSSSGQGSGREIWILDPQKTDLTPLCLYCTPVFVLTDPYRLSCSIIAHFCVALGCSYSILVQYVTEGAATETFSKI